MSALVGLALFAWGVWFGQYLESLRWVRNSKAIQRIECRGRLYKVRDVTEGEG